MVLPVYSNPRKIFPKGEGQLTENSSVGNSNLNLSSKNNRVVG